MPKKVKKLLKEEFLAHWGNMRRKRQIKPKPVAYKHRGSTFDQDGIRITGSPEFVDAVLSRLTDMLEFESALTRLQLSYQPVLTRDSKLPTRAVAAYVQVHERGPEAQMVGLWTEAICGKRGKVDG